MSTLTDRLKLILTPSSADKSFLSWRTEISGETDSNMIKIDTAIADLQDAMEGKQAELTFDTAPTAGSENPVTSGGIKTYVDEAIEAIPEPDIGVSSFNGRTGAVTPAEGDYTHTMVGADAAGSAAAVQTELDAHADNTTVHVTAEERSSWNGKAEKPPKQVISLTAAGWGENTQTVAVPGVLAEELAQLLYIVPASASLSAYKDAAVLCTGQAADSLTFTCEETPAEDLTIYVVITPLA